MNLPHLQNGVQNHEKRGACGFLSVASCYQAIQEQIKVPRPAVSMNIYPFILMNIYPFILIQHL